LATRGVEKSDSAATENKPKIDRDRVNSRDFTQSLCHLFFLSTRNLRVVANLAFLLSPSKTVT